VQALLDYEDLTGALAELFTLAGAAHPRREAISSVALVGGLCQPLLLGDPACPPGEALAVLAAHLDRALPG
jgi:hypothetical protein